MKKRFLSALLALMMLISLVPAAALTASAATFTTSDAAIGMLKEFEGYSKYCKWDNAQWSVGYGTACNGANHPATKVNGDLGGHAITEVEAIADLREELETVEKAVNNFASANGVNMSQSKFDALVLFSYNCGTAWMSGSGTFKQAVVKGITGNDFLYAITLWSASAGETLPGLVNRRLAEANLYLNGVYSVTRPSNYTYVRFDGNGAVASDKVQGFTTSSYTAIKATASMTGKTFMGWYTAAEGGEWVRSLTSAVAGKTLYAHWQDNAAPAASNVSYKMAANSFTSLQPLSKPSTDGTAHGDKLAETDTVSIVQDYVDANGDHWCRVSGSGWLKVGPLVTQDGATPADVVVTVTNSYINVRKSPSTAGALVGKVKQGDKLTITAVKTAANGALWGQFADGWVALMYTDYNAVIESAPDVEEEEKEEAIPEDAVATAVVSCSTYVNVRKGAGMTHATCGSLKNGTNVTIYEIVTVNGHDWGRISTGWFCLDYAVLTMVEKDDADKEETGKDETEKEETEDENAEKPIATGNVVCSTYVNLRSGAGVTNGLVGKLANGSAVKIYEITTVIGHEWGRIGEGVWVCLDYVNYTLVETESGGNTGSEDKEEGSDQTTVTGLFTGTVTNNTLNIRKRADASGTKLGNYVKGDKVGILEVASGVKADGSAAVWGKVEAVIDGETVEGWICLTDYVALDPVNYTVISNTLNVREGAGTAFDKVDKLSKGTVVAISDLAFSGENLWGYSKLFGGWMNITDTYMSRDGSTGGNTGSGDSTETTPGTPSTPNTPVTSDIVGKAVVTSNVKVNIRSGAGLNYGTVGQLTAGTEITVYESQLSGGMIWGRIDQGWICLSYTMFTSTGVTGKGQMATVVNTYTGVNVRSSASTNAALLGKILVNSRVEILEQKTVNGKGWGRTILGWVSMDYILLDSAAGGNMDAILGGNVGTGDSTTGGNTSNDTTNGGTATIEPTVLASYKATTVAATAVYKAAGSDLTVGVELAANADITVYELATVKAGDSETYWARVDEGWILASNVALKDIKETYTVISNTLNVREGAGTAYNQFAKLTKGDVVEVTKLQIVKASIWGYIDAKDGWINTSASYVTLGKVDVTTPTTPTTPSTPSTDNSTSTGTGSTATGAVLYTGTVVRTGNTKLAIRQTPATSGKEVGRLADGTAVKIYEVAIAEYMAWGKTDSGWICLTYVDLAPTNTEAVDVRVIWRDGLSIRAGAGAANDLVGNYAKATVVEIYEFSGNWGRTAEGWVCLDYLLP